MPLKAVLAKPVALPGVGVFINYLHLSPFCSKISGKRKKEALG